MATTARAQTGAAVITGTVTSDQGVPLPGANVYITELNLSVATSSNGGFTITVPAARVSGQSVQVRVRSVGFTPQARAVTLTANGRETVNFRLAQDALRLSEVVVTGVSAATEQVRVPFAVQRVDTTRMPVVGASALAQLQGKVPGAQIVGSGRPGSSPAIVLRGVTSINATNRSQSPLYIIDGVMMQDATGNGTRGGLPDINPADIENIEVVAGAAAASLYGPRAATGVINITTKKGRGGETGIKFGLRSELGAGDFERRWPAAQYHVLGMDPTGTYFCTKEVVGGSPCARYVDIEAERQRVNDQPLDYSLPPQGFLNDFGIANGPSYGSMTGLFQVRPYPISYDPVSQLVTPSASAITNLDARGSFGSGTNFFASVGNTTQQGAVRYLQGYRRNSARLNLDQRIGDKWTAGMQTFYARTWQDGANWDNGSPWFSITRTPAFVDLTARDQYGRLYIRSNPLSQGDQNSSPSYALENIRQINTGGRFIGGANVKYTPLDWLNFGATFGYDRSQGGWSYFYDKGRRTTSSNPATASGDFEKFNEDRQSLNSQVNGTARHTFFGDLETALTGSYVYSLRDNDNTQAGGDHLVVPGLYTLDAVTDGYYTNSSLQRITEIGYLGNLNLTYKGRYVVDGAVRHDGSSLFGPGQRWQTFGRLSGTWIASEEPWWFAPRALKLFKLRANYGKSGNSPAFNQQYETFTIGTGGTLNRNTLGNKDLMPEVKTDVELGADIDLFGRAALSLTWVNSTVDNQILQVTPPASSGFQSQWRNAGALRNRTVEASLDLPLVNRRNVTWSSRLIFDKTVTRITRLDVPPFVGAITVSGNSYNIFQFRQGERIGTFYGTAFATQCGQLPAQFASQCGGDGSAFQRNDNGLIVWVGPGNTQSEGITRNLWTTALPAAQAPWGVRANWGMPIVVRDSTNTPVFAALGNAMPNFHLGMSQNFTFKRLSAYGLVDANVGGKVWNAAYAWSLGDLMSGDIDQYGKSVETAKPIGYYWRRGPAAIAGNSGIGGLYDNLGPNTFNVEDGSYAKLRELSLNYRVGRVGGVGNWTVGVVGRNLYTWTHFRGWDPETGRTGGTLNNQAVNAVAGYYFPNLRTFTLQFSSTF